MVSLEIKKTRSKLLSHIAEPEDYNAAIKEIKHLNKILDEKDLEIAILRDMLKKRLYNRRKSNDYSEVDQLRFSHINCFEDNRIAQSNILF